VREQAEALAKEGMWVQKRHPCRSWEISNPQTKPPRTSVLPRAYSSASRSRRPPPSVGDPAIRERNGAAHGDKFGESAPIRRYIDISAITAGPFAAPRANKWPQSDAEIHSGKAKGSDGMGCRTWGWAPLSPAV